MGTVSADVSIDGDAVRRAIAGGASKRRTVDGDARIGFADRAVESALGDGPTAFDGE